MNVGGKYNWKGQRERLVYIGRNWSGNGYWHQFELVERPGVVWCEVVDADIARFEESEPALATHPLAAAVPQQEAGEPVSTVTALELLKQEALEIFDGPETPQDVRDVIEWYSASVQVILDKARSRIDAALATPQVSPPQARVPLTESVIHRLMSASEVYQYHPGAMVEFVRAVEAELGIGLEAAEIERLKRERDEWRGRITEAHREREAAVSAHEAAQRAGFKFRDEVLDLRRQMAALKAKQVAEADEVLRLADTWVVAAIHKALAVHTGCLTSADPDAAREDLRAAVTKDRT